MSLSHDQVCERPNAPGQGGANSVPHITQLAKQGVAGGQWQHDGLSLRQGYVGKDEFTVEVVFRQGQQSAKCYVHLNVTVQQQLHLRQLTRRKMWLFVGGDLDGAC